MTSLRARMAALMDAEGVTPPLLLAPPLPVTAEVPAAPRPAAPGSVDAYSSPAPASLSGAATTTVHYQQSAASGATAAGAEAGLGGTDAPAVSQLNESDFDFDPVSSQRWRRYVKPVQQAPYCARSASQAGTGGASLPDLDVPPALPGCCLVLLHAGKLLRRVCSADATRIVAPSCAARAHRVLGRKVADDCEPSVLCNGLSWQGSCLFSSRVFTAG